LRNKFNFSLPTEIIYGWGAFDSLAEVLQKKGHKNILLVTTGLRKAGIMPGLKQQLSDAGIKYEFFTDVEPDPSIETVEKGVAVLKEQGATAIVAIGGGSSIDAAKMISIIATNGGKVNDYEGLGKIKKPGLPLVAIPTTAGSGSEVTTFAVITDKEREFKMAIGGPEVAPSIAIVDPKLTVTVPAGLTASTGMDALTHALESYVSRTANFLTEAWSLEAIRLVGEYLRRAVLVGDDPEARDGMMLASLLGGACFSNARLGNVHAMAHPLGGIFHIPHGMANAVLLPYVIKYNALATPHKFVRVAEALGEDVYGLPHREGALKAAEAVAKLSEDIGIPTNLKDVGADESAMDKLVEDTMKSGNVFVNPRKTSSEDIRKIYEDAFAGRLF
jgi:alcohol dehydrogenase class IV